MVSVRWFLLAILILFVTVESANTLRTPLYSTKTGYEDSNEVAGGFSRMLSWQELASELGETADTENCRPVNTYVLYRHGTRYPSEDDIITYQTFLSRLRATAIHPEFDYLKDEPQDRFTVDKGYKLGGEGFKELFGAAARILNRFPSLYYDGQTALTKSSFQSTDNDRSRDSAKGFISGLAGNNSCIFEMREDGATKLGATCQTGMGNVSTDITWSPLEGDRLLEAHDNCPYYNEFKDMAELDDEYTAFRNGPEVEQVIRNIEKRLTGDEKFTATIEEVNVLEKICGMESALFGESNWCNLFSQSDLRVIEYLEDLDEYWYASYGYSINYQPSCVLLNNISSYLQTAVEQKSKTKKGMYKFAHSDTVQGLLSLMDLYRPEVAPLANNYPIDVVWDYSAAIITPFASNIGFTLFQCPHDAGDDVTVDESYYKVLVTHNEQPIRVGTCQTYFCQYSKMTSYIDLQTGACNFDEICSNALALKSSRIFLAIFYLLRHFC